jgi:hypothetical protein
MRIPKFAAVMLPALLLAAPHAFGEEPRAESEDVVAQADEAKEKEFTPPPGFRPRKRGGFTVYCRREEPKGTRFPAEVCYDEQGIREMLQAQREDLEMVDKMRRIYGIVVH